jgi:hypothetical protein
MNARNQSKWDLVDAADSIFNPLILGAAMFMVIYGFVEASQALWPMVA